MRSKALEITTPFTLISLLSGYKSDLIIDQHDLMNDFRLSKIFLKSTQQLHNGFFEPIKSLLNQEY